MSQGMNLRIACVGMVTSLGLDAKTSCAAIRAGLARAAPIDGAPVLDPDSQGMVPLIGHRVWGLTSGGSPMARWLALAGRAFNDMCRDGDLPGADAVAYWRATAVIIVCPVLEDERFFFDSSCDLDEMQPRYVVPLLRSIGVPIEPAAAQVMPHDRTAAMQALRSAQAWLARRSVERVVLLAADSYLDDHSLQWLADADRLKAADRPSGLMPGEAAAAVLLEVPHANQGEMPSVCVRSAAQDAEAGPHLGSERRHGRALARAMGAALLESRLPGPFEGDIVVDLNGEEWRAYEWGSALTQVPHSLLNARHTITPVMSIGDVGAASALTGMVIAHRALARGYSASAAAMVVCTSEDGRVGALVLGRH